MKRRDNDEDRITLLAIELATQLKYGSDQSRLYLSKAKEKFYIELEDEAEKRVESPERSGTT
jgi:hypothetical protein